jgi:hypothetical protein
MLQFLFLNHKLSRRGPGIDQHSVYIIRVLDGRLIDELYCPILQDFSRLTGSA